VKAALRIFDLIHSVDSLPLPKRIGRRAVQAGGKARVLIQVEHVGRRSSTAWPGEAWIWSLVARDRGLAVQG